MKERDHVLRCYICKREMTLEEAYYVDDELLCAECFSSYYYYKE